MVALPIRLSSDLSPVCLRCHRAFDLSPCQLTCPYQVTFDFSDWSPLAGDRSDGCTPIRLCSDLSPVTLRIDLSPFCSANPVPRFDRCPVGLRCSPRRLLTCPLVLSPSRSTGAPRFSTGPLVKLTCPLFVTPVQAQARHLTCPLSVYSLTVCLRCHRAFGPVPLSGNKPVSGPDLSPILLAFDFDLSPVRYGAFVGPVPCDPTAAASLGGARWGQGR
jgi:hypothetical protein